MIKRAIIDINPASGHARLLRRSRRARARATAARAGRDRPRRSHRGAAAGDVRRRREPRVREGGAPPRRAPPAQGRRRRDREARASPRSHRPKRRGAAAVEAQPGAAAAATGSDSAATRSGEDPQPGGAPQPLGEQIREQGIGRVHPRTTPPSAAADQRVGAVLGDHRERLDVLAVGRRSARRARAGHVVARRPERGAHRRAEAELARGAPP